MTFIRELREKEIFESHYNQLAVKTDRMFAGLFVLQWLMGIAMAFWISPRTWAGTVSQTHIHVYAAIFLGAAIAAFPIVLILLRPGRVLNRYVVAVAQMLFSILFIHLTGGRIETHFHIFGSLAFLAFYRDLRPVALATVVTALDHLVRGFYWPESVYGVLSSTPLRALEHAAWVLFEDVFLYISMKNGIQELKIIARHQAEVESTLQNVERIVEQRTSELQETQRQLLKQQQALVASAKMSALGEMAGGVAHEINNPLSIISMQVEHLQDRLGQEEVDRSEFERGLSVVKKTVARIAKIVSGLRFFARESPNGSFQKIRLSSLIDDTLGLCNERFVSHGVRLSIADDASVLEFELECRPVEISQVLLNLLNNAFDAVMTLSEKWVRIETVDDRDRIEIAVVDSGSGVSEQIRDQIMQPFFTTKEVGKGTGLGLSIAKGIVEQHGGRFWLDGESANTRFVLTLPKHRIRGTNAA